MNGDATVPAQPLRVAVLFSRLSGYMAACLRTLHDRHDTELLVVRVAPSQAAPFADRNFGWIDRLFDRAEVSDDDLERVVEEFDPDCILMAGWFDRAYLRVARKMKRQGVVVIAGMDTQWAGTLRQQIGRLAAPYVLHSAIDVIWAAGERQRQTACRLGYRGLNCWSGYYACDWASFASYRAAGVDNGTVPSFLFVGRYVEQKGIDILVDAYHEYRKSTSRPWTLRCAGSGDLNRLLRNEPGIQDLGFIQPDELPGLFGEASVFILPSRREPWGVVVQEAAAAGLPIICSDACGASVHLVTDGHNGFTFESGNASHLAKQMVTITSLSSAVWGTMSKHSQELSKQFTPERWADMLYEGVRSRLKTTW